MQGLPLPPFSQSSQAWYLLNAFKWEDGGSFYYMPMYLILLQKLLGVFGKKPKLSVGDVAVDMLDRKDAGIWKQQHLP
jgi:hypothetical protein